MRSSDTRSELGEEPLLLRVERVRLRWLGSGCLLDTCRKRFSRQVQLVRGPMVDPENTGGIPFLFRPGNALGLHRKSWKALLKSGTSGLPSKACSPSDLARDKWIVNGWMNREHGEQERCTTTKVPNQVQPVALIRFVSERLLHQDASLFSCTF